MKTDFKLNSNSNETQTEKPKVKISQSMIVKNEEKFIERALSWGKDIFFEQIVVDTGSTDRTVEIAEKCGATVYHFEWINDFAAARNYAISLCKGDWIVQADADEYVVEEDVPKLEKILTEVPEDVAQLRIDWISLDDSGEITEISNHKSRIFKNHPQIKYYRCIHEYIRAPQDMQIFPTDIRLMHTPVSTEFKRNLYLSIPEQFSDSDVIPQDPSDQADFFFLKQYTASQHLERAFESEQPNPEYLLKALKSYTFILENCPAFRIVRRSLVYSDLRELYLKLNRKEDAVNITKAGYKEMPNVVFLCIYRGIDLYEEGDIQQAFEIFQKADILCQNEELIPDKIISIELIVTLYEYLIKISEEHAPDIVGLYYTKLLKIDKSRSDILKKWLILNYDLKSEEDIQLIKDAILNKKPLLL
jgi:glycosyltransferase involved in cell wall biosynthesis